MAANKPTILWVDNDAQYIQIYARLLRDAGYNVIIETTIGKAKQRIDQEQRIDLALLDVMIPPGLEDQDLDETQYGYQAGLALGRWIKENHPNLPFVGLSVRMDAETAAWFKEHGSGFITKFDIRDPPDLVKFIESKVPLEVKGSVNAQTNPPKLPQHLDGRSGLDSYSAVSARASWIFGSILVLFLFIVFFLVPCLSSDQRGILRFLMALAGGFFSFFFIGGVVLKGKLQDLVISAAGGVAIFILIQFVSNPFPATNCAATNSEAARPPVNSSAAPVVTPSATISPSPGGDSSLTSNDDSARTNSPQSNANESGKTLTSKGTEERETIEVPLQQTRSALNGAISLSVKVIYFWRTVDGIIGSKEAPDMVFDNVGLGESVIYREKFKIRVIEVVRESPSYVKFEISRLQAH